VLHNTDECKYGWRIDFSGCCSKSFFSLVPMNFAHFHSLRACCRDEAAFEQLQQILANTTQAHEQGTAVLRQQAQQQQALNRVIQTIRNSLDLNIIFSTAAAEIGQLLQVDRVEIVQYLPDRQIWLNVADHRQNPSQVSALGLEIPDAGNPIAAQLKQLQVVRIDDASRCEDEINRAFAQTYSGAWLLVPLYFRSPAPAVSTPASPPTVWGSLSLLRAWLPTGWQDAEVELAHAVADQLAIAIQQSQLYQQVQQLNTLLESQVNQRTQQFEQSLRFEALLKRITDKVRDSLDEGQILQTVVKELALGLNLYGCDTAIYDLEQGISVIHAEHICSHLTPAIGCRFHFTLQADLYVPLLRGRHLQFCFIAPYIEQSRPAEHRLTVLAYPIMDDQSVLGDIWLFQQSGTCFGELELRLVQQVANQCAIAIRQARLYQAAQGQVEKLEALNQLKDDFLSTVSHELRSPMVNIKMALQLLEMALRKDEESRHQDESVLTASPCSPVNHALNSGNSKVAPLITHVDRYLAILKHECDREIILINELLDLQRLEAKAQPLVLEPIPLQEWLPHLIEPFQERARNRQQRFQADIPANLPVLISDVFCLERIVTELLNNACKYTPALEDIVFTVQVRSNLMQFQVMNSGVEIPQSELPRIFDKFHRVPLLDKDNQGGTGLGLALVKRLIEHLGGTIAVVSESNQTCFTIDLLLSNTATCA
jgi:signal transduction histidine kinase